MCHYTDALKHGPGPERIKRVVHGLSHMDFYGAFDAYRYMVLKGVALQKNSDVKKALNQLRQNRVHWIETLNYLISLRRHLEGKTDRHTPSIQACFNGLAKDTAWIDSYAQIKSAALKTPRCQQHARRCQVEFETMERIASTVQTIIEINRVCPLNRAQTELTLSEHGDDVQGAPGLGLLGDAVRKRPARRPRA